MRILSVFSMLAMTVFVSGECLFADPVNLWLPPVWKAKSAKAIKIAESLSHKSGITVKPRIAKSYPELLKAFSSEGNSLAYAGSFAQSIIVARSLGTPLVQALDGREYYSGVMIYPKNVKPIEILEQFPEDIAFSVGASSGESSAKAATGGKASFRVPSHDAAAGAVKCGKAKAAFVKNWWWEDNRSKYATLEMFKLPGISEQKHADNVLSASDDIPADLRNKIANAAIKSQEAFCCSDIIRFEKERMAFSLEMMKKANINPLTYEWR